MPIDFLDKMADKDKDLKMLCEQVADDFLKNQSSAAKAEGGEQKEPVLNKDARKLRGSRPYVRKANLVTDKALNYCWEAWLRFNEFDLFITILRRSYIPPFMDMYQDIIICSKHQLFLPWNNDKKFLEPLTPNLRQENDEASFAHLKDKHRPIIDSIHPIEIGSQTTFFRKILEERAEALLFSEETMNFYQYNLNIVPSKHIANAVVYLMKLMNTLLQSESSNYEDLSRLIFKTARKTFQLKEHDIRDVPCTETVAAMEASCFTKSAAQLQHERDQKKKEKEAEEKKRLEADGDEEKKASEKDDGMGEDIRGSVHSGDGDGDDAPVEEEQQIVEAEVEMPEGPVEKRHVWDAKVARYLAYCVDGGILCSQFTLRTFVKMLEHVREQSDAVLLRNEVRYLLHIRRKDGAFERDGEQLGLQLKNLINDYHAYTMNYRVLVVLIESEYCRKVISAVSEDKSTYPNFLVSVLHNAERNYVKEACCR